MKNPAFIKRILNHYTEELMPVPDTMARYVSTDGKRIKFRDIRNVNFYVPIDLIDMAKSRHDAGQRILGMWVRMNGNTHSQTPRVLKSFLAQFPTK